MSIKISCRIVLFNKEDLVRSFSKTSCPENVAIWGPPLGVPSRVSLFLVVLGGVMCPLFPGLHNYSGIHLPTKPVFCHVPQVVY